MLFFMRRSGWSVIRLAMVIRTGVIFLARQILMKVCWFILNSLINQGLLTWIFLPRTWANSSTWEVRSLAARLRNSLERLGMVKSLTIWKASSIFLEAVLRLGGSVIRGER